MTRTRLVIAVAAAALLVLTPSAAMASEPVSPPLKLALTGFVDTLTCGQEITKDDDATGTLDLRFQCFGDHGVVNWGFKMSPQVRALIVLRTSQ